MKIKNIKHIVAALAVVSLYLMVSACKKDDPKPAVTQVQKVTAMLTANGGTWSPSTGGVVVNGMDVTQDLFPGFSIKFSENTFTTTGTTPVFLRNDTWSFKDETATVIVRGQDGKELTITEISDNVLKFRMTWDQTTYQGGREKSLEGNYEFTLNK